MASSLQARKQELVRDALYDAAIEIFAKKGFEETTVEEVARAAGVSRRSFFRYFASKDDLLAQSVVSYGRALKSGIEACPGSLSPLEVIRQTVISVAKFSASQPRTRQTIDIAIRSSSARQAYLSRLMEVEDSLAEAFAARAKNASRDDLKPRLYSALTVSIMNATMAAWYRSDHEDLSTSSRQVFAILTRVFCEKQDPVPASEILSTARAGERSKRNAHPRKA